MHQAFCLPIIQIVYETLRDVQEGKGRRKSGPSGEGKAKVSAAWKMNVYDRTDAMGEHLASEHVSYESCV